MANSKSLIAYFSRKGNNYVGSSIVNLPIGNTEVIAKKIQELTAGNIFKINTVKSYPEDYTETTNEAQEEKTENARPELIEKIDEMDSYDVIISGIPYGGERCRWRCSFLCVYLGSVRYLFRRL